LGKQEIFKAGCAVCGRWADEPRADNVVSICHEQTSDDSIPSVYTKSGRTTKELLKARGEVGGGEGEEGGEGEGEEGSGREGEGHFLHTTKKSLT
jgi:hypothetical protein